MKQNIFRFDISMYDIAIMHKLDRMTHLLDDLPHLLLLVSALALQLAVDVPAEAEF
jgi:hypothetical protein